MYGPTTFVTNVSRAFPGNPHVDAVRTAFSAPRKTPQQRYAAVEKAVGRLMRDARTDNATRKLAGAWHRYQAWHRAYANRAFPANLKNARGRPRWPTCR